MKNHIKNLYQSAKNVGYIRTDNKSGPVEQSILVDFIYKQFQKPNHMVEKIKTRHYDIRYHNEMKNRAILYGYQKSQSRLGRTSTIEYEKYLNEYCIRKNIVNKYVKTNVERQSKRYEPKNPERYNQTEYLKVLKRARELGYKKDNIGKPSLNELSTFIEQNK